jgi:hypothetical protein
LGIYDKKVEFNFVSVTKQIVPFAIGLVVLIGLFLLFNIFSEMLKPQAIVASFNDNPLDLTKGNSFTKLSLTVTNTLKENAPNVFVKVGAENPEAIIIVPTQADLGLIEKGNKRITEFIVRPNPAKKVLAGTYTINILVTMNNEQFKQSMVLEIKTV